VLEITQACDGLAVSARHGFGGVSSVVRDSQVHCKPLGDL
jgi:hypothetical protein